MSGGFCLFYEIGKVVTDLRFFLNHSSKVYYSTNIELKKKSYTRITMIHIKYIWG